MKLITYSLPTYLQYLLLIFISLCSTNIQAQGCKLHLDNLVDVEIKTNTSSGNTHYNIVQDNRNETFKVRNSGGSCSFFISFSGSSHIRYLKSAQDKIAYGIYDSVQRNNPLIGLPTATERNIQKGEFKENETNKTFTYFYFLDVDDAISAGEYSDSMQIELYEGTLGNHILHDTKTIEFLTNIESFINVTVQGGQGSGKKTRLHFGTAKPGISLGFEININANTGYDMLLESQNRGVMRLDSHRVANTIPYLLFKDGHQLDISNKVQLPYMNTIHSIPVVRHDFIVTIDEFNYVLSGEYKDTITITVMAR